MKRALGLMMLFAVGCVNQSVTKEEEYVKLKERPPRPREARPLVAIADFVDKTGYGGGKLGGGSSDVLLTELMKTQQVRCVERQQVSKAMDEMKLEHSGITDAATAAKVGKGLNVKYFIYGTISNFGTREERSGILLIAGSKTYVASAEVDVRIIEVETQEVVYAQNGNGQATIGSTASILGGSSTGFDPAIVGKALRAAIVKMLDDMMDQME